MLYWTDGADRWDRVVCNEHESLKEPRTYNDNLHLKHDQRVTELSDLHHPVNRTSPQMSERKNKMEGFFRLLLLVSRFGLAVRR